MITGDTTLARLLEAHPALGGFLASYHEALARLIRRPLASRVTVAEAARAAGVALDELVGALRRAAGEPAAAAAPPARPAAATASRPAALDGLRRVDLDVRDDIRRGREPFARIMAAVGALADGEALVLRVPFEPVPLYGVLARRGLDHWAERGAGDDWAVWFYRAGTAAGADAARAGAARRVEPPPSGARRRVLDVRGLEPPRPMVAVLEHLDALGPDEELLVVHERRPMFLYPQLDERGFVHETTEAGPGLVHVLIRRSPSSCPRG